MAGKLASPTFVTGANDDVATADVYSKTDAVVVNSIQDLATKTDVDANGIAASRGGDFLKGALSSVKGALSSVTGKLGDLASGAKGMLASGGLSLKGSLPTSQGGGFLDNARGFLSTAKSGLGVLSGVTGAVKSLTDGKADLLSRLQNSSNAASGALRNMSGPMADKISGFIKDSKDVTAMLGTAQRVIKTGDLSSVRSLSRLAGDFTGNKDFIKVGDLAADVSIMAGMVSESARFGLPNSFGELSKTLTNLEHLNKVAGKVLPDLVKFGDLQSLKSVADVTSFSSVNILNPQIVTDFSKMYVSPAACTAEEYKREYGSAMDMFNSVDNSWNRMTRQTPVGPEEVINITPLQNTSEDFSKVMAAGVQASPDPKEKLYAVSALYETTEAKAELAKQFPMTAISADHEQITNPVVTNSEIAPIEVPPLVTVRTIQGESPSGLIGDITITTTVTGTFGGETTKIVEKKFADGSIRRRKTVTSPNGESSTTSSD